MCSRFLLLNSYKGTFSVECFIIITVIPIISEGSSDQRKLKFEKPSFTPLFTFEYVFKSVKQKIRFLTQLSLLINTSWLKQNVWSITWNHFVIFHKNSVTLLQWQLSFLCPVTKEGGKWNVIFVLPKTQFFLFYFQVTWLDLLSLYNKYKYI